MNRTLRFIFRVEIELHFMYVDAEIIIDAKVAAIDSRLSKNISLLYRLLFLRFLYFRYYSPH